MGKYIKLADRLKNDRSTFEIKVLPESNTGCWIWMGSTSKQGYGYYKYEGETIAHRASYTLYKGEIPLGIHVCHTCDNPSCVNPNHLFLGTNLQNMRDRNNKGRQAKGTSIHSSKLTSKQVTEIQARYVPYKVTAKVLAKDYGVTPGTIYSILKGKSWKHLTGSV